MKKLLTVIMLVIVLSLGLAGVGYAEETSPAFVESFQKFRPESAVYIPIATLKDRAAVPNVILQIIAGSLIYLAGPVAVYMLVLGGFNYIISHGDQTKIEEAKKGITWAIIGLLVIIMSFALVSLITSILETAALPEGSTPAGDTTQQAPATKP